MNERKCESIAELIAAYVDNEVTTEERALVQAHIDDCPSCAARLADYQTLQKGIYQYLAASPVASLEHAGLAHPNMNGNGSMSRQPVARANRSSIPSA